MIDFRYDVIRNSNRKTANLSVSPDNKVSIIVPNRLMNEEVETIVQKKSQWIREKIKFNNEVKYPFKEKEYVSGESILYNGRNFRLKILERLVATPARLNSGWLVVPVAVNTELSERERIVKNAIEDWYKKVALSKVKARCKFYENHLERKPADIIIKSLKSRWGSCYKSRVIAFNWKIVMAPLKIIDYVVVHELCHLKYHDHSSKYWELLGSIIPDWRERKEWLRVNGGLLSI
jgi:predicted metal-dependent hydrolase